MKKLNLRKDEAMEEIRDMFGRLLAYGNSMTGEIESEYRKQLTIAKLSVGEEIIIVRDGILTTITRTTPQTLRVDSDYA